MKAIVEQDKIKITFAFDWSLVNVVKDINGRRYDDKTKTWVLPFSGWHCAQVVDKLLPLGFEIDSAILKNSEQKSAPPKNEYPKGLYPFQRRGADFLFSTSGRAIVADEMGLGKTIEALAYVGIVSRKVLIVAPASVIFKWQAECTRWLSVDWTSQVITTGKEEMPNVDILVMSYAIMVARYQELANIPFDTIIFDEAHYIKSPKSQRTRVAKALVKRFIPHILFLSGTPFMNRPVELFPLLNMLDPIGFSNFTQFAKQYCGAVYEMGHWFFPKNVATNTDELAERLRRYMIRRTKKDVELDLPDLTRAFAPVDIDMSDYNKARKDMKAWLAEQDRSVLNPAHVLTRLAVLRQVAGMGKISAAVELAESVLDEGRKVVLFCHHRDVVSKLRSDLSQYGVLVIDGSTSAKERSSNANQFLRQDSSDRVMIITVAGSEGIDLYSASDIIFVEREWTPAKEEQAEARLHRMGQKSPVTAYYIVAKGTVDEKLNEYVESKRKVVKSVIRTDEVVQYIMESL